MASIDFGLSELFEQAFGYRSEAFQPKLDTTAKYYSKNNLGVDYFMPVTVTFNGISWRMPNPIVAVTSKKVVVETPLTERVGTVKELISSEDYEITIKGIIINGENEFPENDFKFLTSLYECNKAVQINSGITDVFLVRPGRSGSDNVVVKELKIPEVRGVKNVWAYEIVFVSDEPFSLYTIKE